MVEPLTSMNFSLTYLGPENKPYSSVWTLRRTATYYYFSCFDDLRRPNRRFLLTKDIHSLSLLGVRSRRGERSVKARERGSRTCGTTTWFPGPVSTHTTRPFMQYLRSWTVPTVQLKEGSLNVYKSTRLNSRFCSFQTIASHRRPRIERQKLPELFIPRAYP